MRGDQVSVDAGCEGRDESCPRVFRRRWAVRFMSSLPCSLQTENDEMSSITTWMRALALGLGALRAAWRTFFALASSVGEVSARGEPFIRLCQAICSSTRAFLGIRCRACHFAFVISPFAIEVHHLLLWIARALPGLPGWLLRCERRPIQIAEHSERPATPQVEPASGRRQQERCSLPSREPRRSPTARAGLLFLG